MRRAAVLILASGLGTFPIAHAADKKEKDKDKDKPAAQAIDYGSFGIFVKGQRVATESFSIEQQNGNSVIKSQLKGTGGDDSSNQKSNLQMNSAGELLRYEWNQPSGASLTVFPENDFLKERLSASAGAKPAEQAFLLPSTSPVLDNNFFVHREILAWRFLNAICQVSGGDTKCKQEPADFGALVPQDHTSMSVRLELVGREKVTMGGVEREMMRLKLTSENYQWTLWVDDHDHFKLMRVAIPADSTVVDRD
jgi:hypothetical protein